MKRNITIFTCLSILLYLTLSGYREGPAAFSGLNRTGSDGAPPSCAGGGCHNSNQATTTGQLQIFDPVSGLAVTSYKPGTQYTVALSGANSSTANLPGFGFQTTAILTTGKTAGNFKILAPNPGIQISAVGSQQIVEHAHALSDTTANTYIVRFAWTAPAAGSGNVTFFSILNAVNLDGNTGGDYPNSIPAFVVTEQTTAVVNIPGTTHINVYPNPVINTLHLSMENATAGLCYLSVYNANGKTEMNMPLLFNTSSGAAINTSGWERGVHIVQIVKDGLAHTFTIIKQ